MSRINCYINEINWRNVSTKKHQLWEQIYCIKWQLKEDYHNSWPFQSVSIVERYSGLSDDEIINIITRICFKGAASRFTRVSLSFILKDTHLIIFQIFFKHLINMVIRYWSSHYTCLIVPGCILVYRAYPGHCFENIYLIKFHNLRQKVYNFF